MAMLRSLLLCLPLLVIACATPLVDDAFEPNDQPDQATVLVEGKAVTARALEGNPDYFAFAVEAGEDAPLVFQVEHIERDCCIGFELVGPGGEVLLETRAGCPVVTRPLQQAEGVELRAAIHRFDYSLVVEQPEAGLYLLRLLEGSVADGWGPYAWDYRIQAVRE